MIAKDTNGTLPLSVIIPARNEETCLGACLESLLAQSDVAFEIIVVDDHSTDHTRQLAESFGAKVRVIEAGSLPEGWTGKNNAVTAGAKAARGEWLLFTDADTIHRPGSLARSLAEAKSRGADLLSYSPQQLVTGFWQRAVMPVIFAELAASFRPTQVSDPKSSVAAANGQYILVSRAAYNAVGGHAAVATSLLEDVALARAVKRSGRKIFFRYGTDAVQTRMYRTFAHLREGWTKNLALLFPSTLRLALLRMIEFILIIAGITIALTAALRGHLRPAIVAGLISLILYAFLLARIRHAHFSWDANILAFFGLPLFSYLLVRSAKAHSASTVSWKGRAYETGETKADHLDTAVEAVSIGRQV
jgi:glycosyltransferase involved in cell wall biosynthesis